MNCNFCVFKCKLFGSLEGLQLIVIGKECHQVLLDAYC